MTFAACVDRAAEQGDRANDVLPSRDSASADRIDVVASVHPMPDSTENTAPVVDRASVVVAPERWPDDVRASGRRPTSVRLRSRWSYAASWDDTTMLQPAQATVTQRTVIVYDRGHVALLGLRREDGVPRWRQGRQGSGPGEIQRGAMTQASDTSVYFFDDGLRRLTEWSDTGGLFASRAVSRIGLIRGLCRTDDGNVYVSIVPDGQQHFLGLARLPAGADSAVDQRSLPFDRPIHRTGMDAQMPIFPLGDGSCALGPLNESWIVFFSDIDAMQRVALVEHVPVPTVVETKAGEGMQIGFAGDAFSGVRGVARFGDFIAVAFGGRTSARRRLVDVYHRDPWRYEGSIVLPGVVQSISARDSTFVIVSEDTTGFGRIDAFTVDASRVR